MYTWPGMKKITWAEVNDLAMKGKLVGYYLLYADNSEGMITIHTSLEEIVKHYHNGGEFGIEKTVEKVAEWCSHCCQEVEINSIGVQVCPNCGEMILPCCMCEDCYGKCIYSDEKEYKLCKDEKENHEYWNNLEVITNRYVEDVCRKCMNDIYTDDERAASSKVLEMVIEAVKSVGGVFPARIKEESDNG